MKKILLLITLLTATVAVQAQTVDEILTKYFAQVGGKDKLAAQQSMKASGKLKVQGMELPLTVMAKAPNKTIAKVNFQGKEMIFNAFDGTTAWATNQMTLKPEAQSSEDSENAKDEQQIQDPFIDYAAKGYKAELVGKETIEGTECHKIKLTRKPVKVEGKDEENTTEYFFSVADNVPIMTRSFMKKGPMKGKAIESYMSDYQDVNGLMVPFTMAQKMNGQQVMSFTFEKIENNVPVEDTVFVFPVK